MRYLLLLVGLFLAVVVIACEPTIAGTFDVTYDYPYCPTTDSLYFAADSVPLGCPLPTDPLGLRVAPKLVQGDGSWLQPAERWR